MLFGSFGTPNVHPYSLPGVTSDQRGLSHHYPPGVKLLTTALLQSGSRSQSQSQSCGGRYGELDAANIRLKALAAIVQLPVKDVYSAPELPVQVLQKVSWTGLSYFRETRTKFKDLTQGLPAVSGASVHPGGRCLSGSRTGRIW